jgi:ribosomal protein S18 acetylase RimI-like enzyme
MKTQISDQPAEADLEALKNGLNAANTSQGALEAHDLGIFLKENDQMIAGLYGQSYWDWLYVKYLWVAEEYQHQGLGTKLMTLAEAEASKRGCVGIHLNTFSFQGLEFYQKLGYTVFGEIDDHPQGEKRIYLLKRIR